MQIGRPLNDLTRRAVWPGLAALMIGGIGPEVGGLASVRAEAQAKPSSEGADTASKRDDRSQADTSQVTVVGILVTPGDGGGIDPKLSNIKNQLRKLFPNHGFKLLDVRSAVLAASDRMSCELGKGKVARVTLLDPLDSSGKVRLRCEFAEGDKTVGATDVTTPPNQLFFYDRKQADGTRLLIGVGAR